MPESFTLSVLPGTFAVVQLPPGTPTPAWVPTAGDFVSVSWTHDECSVVCVADAVPAGVKADARWRTIKLHGPFPFTTVGVLARLSTVLAGAQISIFVISTFDTDYILCQSPQLGAAVAALRAAGHEVLDDAAVAAGKTR